MNATTSFQTIVLSGGGSKGAYGLGVLLALDKFHRERNKKVTKVFCGTSVGALNATLAAQGDLQQLSELYATLKTKDVLGTSSSKVGGLKMALASKRRPFHCFKTDALRGTIERYVRFAGLKKAHLLVCVTNYITGDLETFYVSDLVDEFVAREEAHDPEHRRLDNYHRIESEEHLVQVLLASTAIPFYFPPVQIGKSLYVDGGVGNNTPLRQAAYICRFLQERPGASVEPTFCVINDPCRFSIDRKEAAADVFGVIRRAMDIFHNELVRDSRASWDRINREIQSSRDRENVLASHIEGLDGVAADARVALKERVVDALRSTNTVTKRQQLPLMVVQPSSPLVDDILRFDPKDSTKLKRHGVDDCLKLLRHKDFITHNDYTRWLEAID
jgi:hypothetical protein